MAKRKTMFKDYWQTRMTSAEQRLAAALQLISHKPTRGTLAEEVLREIVDAFLPGQWASHSGFVVDANQSPSNQLDILIYDQLASTPLYRDASVVVLPTGTKPIAIEVKSVLNKKDLFEALANVASLKSMESNPKDVGAIIYAYRGFVRPSTLATHLKTHVRSLRRKGKFDPEHLPDMICIQEQNLVALRTSNPAFKFVGYDMKTPVIQSLLTQMLNSLRVPNLYSLLPEPHYNAPGLFQIT